VAISALDHGVTAATGSWEKTVDSALAALRRELGGNLYSCCLYGSAVRGNMVRGVSDVNLLIVLDVSDPAAHEAVARAIGAEAGVDPFVLGREGFARSVQAFAAKFSSILRNYRVLHGADPLAGITLAPALERFLCEQALRNLRLRTAHSFVTRARHCAHGRFLMRSVTPLFLRLSEIVRLEGAELPGEFSERIVLFERMLGLDGAVLRELLELKKRREPLTAEEAAIWHGRFFPLTDVAIHWIEAHWPQAVLEEDAP
jgi:hypothetical protein